MLKQFVAVFSSPDPEAPPVFWGAFTNHGEAMTAVEEFLAHRPYWSRDDFTLTAFPFGELL
jgi:hypothetical protein